MLAFCPGDSHGSRSELLGSWCRRARATGCTLRCFALFELFRRLEEPVPCEQTTQSQIYTLEVSLVVFKGALLNSPSCLEREHHRDREPFLSFPASLPGKSSCVDMPSPMPFGKRRRSSLLLARQHSCVAYSIIRRACLASVIPDRYRRSPLYTSK